MRTTGLRILLSLLAMTLTTAPLTGQWLTVPTPGLPRTGGGGPDLAAPPPRDPDSKPDLSGIWRRVGPNVDAKTRAATFTGEDLRFFMPAGATIPLLPDAKALFELRQRREGAGSPSERCLPKGVPRATLAAPFRIIQTRNLTAILFEEFNGFRQIHTDGRAHPHDPQPFWWGYSIGRWEGDTFVVSTTGFNDSTWLDKAGHPHTEQLRTTERFRRLNVGTLELEVTIDDPGAYSRPWTVPLRFRLLADTELLELVCENEKSAARIKAIHGL